MALKKKLSQTRHQLENQGEVHSYKSQINGKNSMQLTDESNSPTPSLNYTYAEPKNLILRSPYESNSLFFFGLHRLGLYSLSLTSS